MHRTGNPATALAPDQTHPSQHRPVAFTPLDWSTDAGMEIPPRARPPSHIRSGRGTPGKILGGQSIAALTFARNFGTPTGFREHKPISLAKIDYHVRHLAVIINFDAYLF